MMPDQKQLNDAAHRKKVCPCGGQCAACALLREINPNALEVGHAYDCICHGTGKVFFFGDGVRKACPCLDAADANRTNLCQSCWRIRESEHSDSCFPCQGRGTIGSTDMNDWVKAVWERGWGISFAGGECAMWMPSDPNTIAQPILGYGPDPFSALIAALEKAADA